MKKVVVVGSGGAGKSTFARCLGEITGIPVVHLDVEYWRPNWEKTPEDEWKARVQDLISRDAWIMDGNFGGTRELRMGAADTVVFLDLPRYVCLYRILKRAVLYYGRSRPDMADGCNEQVNTEFISWVWNYRKQSRVRLMREISAFPAKKIEVLRSRAEVKSFLERVERQYGG